MYFTFLFDGTDSKFKSYADKHLDENENTVTCSGGCDTSGTPSTATDCHAAVHRIVNCQTMDSNADFAIIFTGHDICTHGGNGKKPHEDCRGIRITSKEKEWCIVQNRDTTGKELRTLIHEIGHIYKAPDHYDKYTESETDNKKTTQYLNANKETLFDFSIAGSFDNDCIFGRNSGLVDVGNHKTVMCDGCHAVVTHYANLIG